MYIYVCKHFIMLSGNYKSYPYKCMTSQQQCCKIDLIFFKSLFVLIAFLAYDYLPDWNFEHKNIFHTTSMISYIGTFVRLIDCNQQGLNTHRIRYNNHMLYRVCQSFYKYKLITNTHRSCNPSAYQSLIQKLCNINIISERS